MVAGEYVHAAAAFSDVLHLHQNLAYSAFRYERKTRNPPGLQPQTGTG